ncbi:DUF4870 domain-containing protein [Crassaminicella thermophila]|uniref:DUF4870 domain-containing protein n=1 Tax=Crassaminicella thermophila TaxID=2599308 RepID=A0A5C0SH58_CRATE|nr:DUF4870 domain-containing protein [Crassaminicella thermophila]QEK13661.1 DUF4870 domain-containing protein [Crassaminicella thermophila]
MLTTEQKLLCGIAHLGWIVGFPIIAPLIIMLLTKDIFVKNQAKEALVFQIGLVILGAIFGFLCILLVGFPLLIILGIASLIFPVIAVIRVCDGIDYSYPITGSFARKNL